MEEKRTKLSFSILPSKPTPPKPTATRPAAFSAAASTHTGPAAQFVTTFDPSQTLAPPVAPPVVIAPLPNSRALAEPSAAARVVDASDNNPSPSSGAGYGLALRDTEESKRKRLAAPDAAAAATRRFKQDMAVLPDTQGADEYDEVPVEGFGAALLAGYGWKEGNPVGRDKSKGDPKIVEHGRRIGTQGLGAGPSDNKSDSAVRPAVRRSVRVLREIST